MFINGLIAYVLYYYNYGELAWNMFAYNNPVIVVATLMVCMFVVNVKSVSYNFSKISKYAFAIYLLTDCSPARSRIFAPLKYFSSKINCYILVLCILVYAMALSVVCIGIDVFRKLLYDQVALKFVTVIGRGVKCEKKKQL